MHFRHIAAKIQTKNLKQHFDWGGPGLLGPLAVPLKFNQLRLRHSDPIYFTPVIDYIDNLVGFKE